MVEALLRGPGCAILVAARRRGGTGLRHSGHKLRPGSRPQGSPHCHFHIDLAARRHRDLAHNLRQRQRGLLRKTIALCGLIAALCPPALAQTAADDPVRVLVGRLDLERYKATIKGLAAFGDRRQGTDRNRAAIDWIEGQLKSFGCATERLKYVYDQPPRSRPQQGQAPSPVIASGAMRPGEMYIIGAHMDGIGWGEAADDNASGTALVMELARVLNGADVRTERSIRFALWNNEETGLNGSRAYVAQRAALQGKEDPPGSGRYPE